MSVLPLNNCAQVRSVHLAGTSKHSEKLRYWILNISNILELHQQQVAGVQKEVEMRKLGCFGGDLDLVFEATE